MTGIGVFYLDLISMFFVCMLGPRLINVCITIDSVDGGSRKVLVL